MNAPLSDGTQAGFTLVEMLVALTLLAMLGMLMLLGYQTVVPSWRRAEARSDTGRELGAAHDLLRDRLSRAYPAVIGEPGARHIDFEGTASALNFLAPLPQRSGAAAVARYAVHAAGDGTLRMSTGLDFHSDQDLTAAEPAETVLLDGLSLVRFTYFGSDTPSDPPQWHERWSGRKTLPELVRVHVERRDGQPFGWPDLVIAPLVTADDQCAFDPLDGKCRAQ
jgi:general secretion pathway protein J